MSFHAAKNSGRSNSAAQRLLAEEDQPVNKPKDFRRVSLCTDMRDGQCLAAAWLCRVQVKPLGSSGEQSFCDTTHNCRIAPTKPKCSQVLSYSDLDETKPQQGGTGAIDPCCANTEPAMKAVATMLA